LPETLPSSFEHPWGHIRYKLRFEINRKESSSLPPFQSNNYLEKSFSLANTLDLNEHSYFKKVNTIKISKQVRSCCCINCGLVTLTLSLSQTGFVPGQMIPFGLIIQNDSLKTLRHVYVYLIQQVYIQTCSSLRVVSKFKLPQSVAPRTTEIASACGLQIPAVCESFSENLIKVNYVIMVRFDKKDTQKINLKKDYLTVPIFIGTRPFLEDLPRLSCLSYRPCVFGLNYNRNDQYPTEGTVGSSSELDFRPIYAMHSFNLEDY
jgi:hypothetical protein